MEKDSEGFYLVPIFSGQSNRLGCTYDNAAKVFQKELGRGPIPVCYGVAGADEFKHKFVDEQRVCGFVSGLKFLEESELIQGLFKATPSGSKNVDDLLSSQPPSFSIRQGSPRFGIRGHGKVDKNGKHVIERIISIDLLSE